MSVLKRLCGVSSVVILCGLSLSACNTIAGIGRDLQNVGEKMESSAESRGAAKSTELRVNDVPAAASASKAVEGK